VTAPTETDRDRPGVAFWIGLVIGGAVMAFGIRGAFMNSRATDPAVLVQWVVGADLVHDLLIAPIAIGVGWAATRIVPLAARIPVQLGLVATGVVLIVGWAPLRGYGRATVPDNPSVQPLDYSTAILTVLVAVWVVVGAWITVRLVRARR
jgi:hypothetical protein